MSRIVPEAEFRERLLAALATLPGDVGWVTGPGRSGAVAAAYASHALRVPFVPYGSREEGLVRVPGRLLIVDTAEDSGATLRRAARRYSACRPLVLAVYREPPRVRFWYEAPEPQLFRHEVKFKA